MDTEMDTASAGNCSFLRCSWGARRFDLRPSLPRRLSASLAALVARWPGAQSAMQLAAAIAVNRRQLARRARPGACATCQGNEVVRQRWILRWRVLVSTRRPFAGDTLMLDVMLAPASAVVVGISHQRPAKAHSSRPGRPAVCAAGVVRHTRPAGRLARRRSSPDQIALVACDVGTSSSPAPPFPCVPRCVPACVLRTAVQPPQRQGARPAPHHDRRQAQTTLLPAHGRQSGSASERPGLSARCRRRSLPMAGIFWNGTQHCFFLTFQMFQTFRPVFARASLEHLPEHLTFQTFRRHVPVWRVGHQAPLPTPCSASARTT